MSARGDESQAKKARDTLTMSVIGLIIVFGAYAITAFVFTPEAICEDITTMRECNDQYACAWASTNGQPGSCGPKQ